MGRKIPAKKHRGVKNPLEQQARREKSLKSKINAPPKDPDEQPVPRSLTRLFAFRDNARSVTRRKPNDKKMRLSDTHEQKCMGKNPVSGLKRLPGESGRSFSLRINGAVRALHLVDTGDLHHPQEMEAEDAKGERMAEQRARRRRKRGDLPPRPPRAPRRVQAERDKADQAAQERAEVRYERVEFGEVAHAPPALRPPTAAGVGAARPGRRALLLTPLLAGGAAPAPVARR